MSSARSRAGAPGEMIELYKLPANDKAHDVMFLFLNGVASFVDFKGEDKNLKPEGTKGWFCKLNPSGSPPNHKGQANMMAVAHGSTLMLETNARVRVESPPSDGLPSDFDCTYLPSSSTKPKIPRNIYLRHRDTVHFEDYSSAVHISVARVSYSANTSFAEGDKPSASTEIQVKSSAHAPIISAHNPAGPDDETEDEDDLDNPIHTPLGAEDSTPATSRPTDNLAVKDTPSRPFSRESNHIYSTARENGLHNDGADGSTPAARAGASRGKKAKANPSEDAESQFVFGNSKRQTKYGGTPKPKRQAKNETIESPSKSDLPSEPNEAIVAPRPRRSSVNVDENTAISMSSPNRKRSFHDSDEEEDMAPPASTAPLPKKARGRGRPAKEPEAIKPIPTKSGKKRGRPSKGSRVEDDQDDAVEPPSSTGKLKRPRRKSEADEPEAEDGNDEVVGTRRRTNASPDLDPRASSTPQSSTPHGSGKAAPTKVLLSNSKYGDDSKAKNWLKKHGASVDEKVPGKRSNFVCVVAVGELLATPKVLRSVALGKRVVTDQWIKLSMEQNQLLDLDDYVHDDLAPTMSVDRSKLLQGKALFITSALEKVYGDSFAHLKELAATVGAHRVEVGTAKKASGLSDAATIFLGRDGDDPDAQQLAAVDGRAVYQKNLLTQSILRGELLLEHEEFKWSSKPGKGKKGKK